MKFRLMLASIVAVTASLSFAESAEEEDAAASTNLVGVLKLKKPTTEANAKKMLVSVPWTAFGSSISNSLDQLVKTANLSVGDTVNVYNVGTMEYESWKLVNSSGETGEMQWQSIQTVVGGGEPKTSGSSSSLRFKVGDAIRLNRDNPGDFLYVMGKAPESGTVVKTEFKGKGTYLLAPPVPTAGLKLSDIPNVWTWEGRSDGDILYVPLTSGSLTKLTVKNGSFNINAKQGASKLLVGGGMWYEHISDGSVTVTATIP